MRFQDLTKRLVFSLMSLFLITAILIFAYLPWMQYLICFLVAVIGAIGIWEYAKLTRINKRHGYVILLICLGAFLIFSFFISTESSTFLILPLLCLFISMISLFIYHFNKIEESCRLIALGFFSLFYVALPLGLLLKILYMPFAYHVGRIWIIYLLVVTKVTDVGAYFGGRLIGNKKLAVDISPQKTIAGAIIGFLSAICVSVIFYRCTFFIKGFHFTFVQSIWLGILLGILGQAGDLAESLIKRDADVKDSNRLPGLGGILDMLDSLFFTIFVIYFFLYLII